MANRFDSFKFEEYKFREYPKHVTDKDGKTVAVQSRAEEDEVLAAAAAEDAGLDEVADEGYASPAEEREALLAEAAELGVDVKKGWALPKLKAVVEAARG